jgi:hypothetical protein
MLSVYKLTSHFIPNLGVMGPNIPSLGYFIDKSNMTASLEVGVVH